MKIKLLRKSYNGGGGDQILIHHEVVYLQKSRESKICILIQYLYFCVNIIYTKIRVLYQHTYF